MRRRTLVIITIVTIVGVYAGIFYLRRIRGYEFPIADGLVWRITDPPQRLRSWIGIDMRWRKLVARSWETGNGGYVKVQRDGRAEFSLDSYHYDGAGVFGTEWPDDTNHDMAHSLGFTMRFSQDGLNFWLELHPQKDDDGIMRGNGIEARIYRMADNGKSGSYEVYHSRLKQDAEHVMDVNRP